MGLETMFLDQRWNILRCLSEGRYSPLQLAEKLNTTMANISQQLRLLETANLVKKQKIKNRDKGKPRSLFSLTEDCAYLILAMHNFADKKLLKINEHHKIILKIWFLEMSELHQHLEKLYWKIEPYLTQIQAIAVRQPAKEAIIIADKPDEIEKIANKSNVISVKVYSTEEAQRMLKRGKAPFSSLAELSIIYEHNNFFQRIQTEVIS